MKSFFEKNKLLPVDKIITIAESLIDQSPGSEIKRQELIGDTLSLRISFRDIDTEDATRDHFVSELINIFCVEFDDVNWIERIEDEFDDDSGDLLVDINIAGLPN